MKKLLTRVRTKHKIFIRLKNILCGIVFVMAVSSLSAQTYQRVDYILGQTTPNAAVSASSNTDITTNAPSTGTRIYSYFYETGADQTNDNIKAIMVYNVPSGTSTTTNVSFIKESITEESITETYYGIADKDHLRALSAFVMKDISSSANIENANTYNKTFKLTSDITFTSEDNIFTGGNWTANSNFIPIGGWNNASTCVDYKIFAGTFNGNNHTITGLEIHNNTSGSNSNNSYYGLFGLTHSAIIKQLRIVNANISTISTSFFAGGLVGKSNNDAITDCYVSSSNISGAKNVGGLIGSNSGATINNCSVTKTVISGESIVGGLIGNNIVTTLNNCYVTHSTVSSTATAGGFVGALEPPAGSAYCTATNCYSTAKVIGGSDRHGFCAISTGVELTNCHYINIWNPNNIGVTEDATTRNNSAQLASNTQSEMQAVGFAQTMNNNQIPEVFIPDSYGRINDGYPIFQHQNTNLTYDYKRVDYMSDGTSTVANAYGLLDIGTEGGGGTRLYSYFYANGAEQINDNILAIEVYTVPTRLNVNFIRQVIGTEDYYEIADIDHLRALSAFVMYDISTTANIADANTYNKTFKLISDITFTSGDNIFTGNNWTANSNFGPIGGWKNISEINTNKMFAGTFIGNNHTIKGLEIHNSTSNSYCGLFGYNNGTIKDLVLDNANISASQNTSTNAGCLVGYNNTISGCHITNSNVSSATNAGVLVGFGYGSNNTISGCYVTNSNVSSATNAGSLVGQNQNAIDSCYVRNSYVSATNAGGFVGMNSGNITYCYITRAVVLSDSKAGGFVGENNSGSSINLCYAVAKVKRTAGSTSTSFGGFYGSNATSTAFSMCCYVKDIWNVDNITGITENANITTAMTSTTTLASVAQSTIKAGFSVNYYNSEHQYKDDAPFGNNYGYPIFFNDEYGKIDPYTIIDGEEMIVPSIYDRNASLQSRIPSNITIEDGGSLINLTTVTPNVTIQRKLKVKEWNLFGPTTTGQTYALLNNNVGTESSGKHDMVITPFDYTANTWGSYITPTTINNSLTIGTSSFVYPLENIITIAENGTVTDVTTNSTEYTIVSQTAAEYKSDVTFGTGTGNLNLNNNGSASTGNTVNGLWFALSNPYSGRLLPREICTSITNTQGESAVYTYNATSGAWETPAYVYPGQGFMVATTSATTLTGKLTKSARTSKASVTTPSYITFICQANNTTKDAFARISEQASNGFDQKDAYVLLSSNNENLVEPYFLVDNHAVMKNIYKTMPYITPINFHASKVSNTNLTVSNIPNNVKVSIIDLSNGNETALENGSTFNFVANQGENSERFVVKFGKNNVSIDNMAEENNISLAMYPNPATSQTTLMVDGLTNSAKVFVNDIQGRTINTYTINKGQSIIRINTEGLASGVYYVRVVSNNLIKTEKLIVK
jgi:hypothetical protein